MKIQSAIEQCANQADLTQAEMQAVMRSIMSGECTSAQIAGLLIALRMKGETSDEISAAAKVMTEFAHKVECAGEHTIDIVGTGGDGANTFNVSTASSFVAAAAGAQVAKHGNRSVSSQSGSADYLEQIGANINLNTEQVAQVLATTGVGFMFAPMHHSAMKYAIAPRKELGLRTIFNVLGPLTNPAQVQRQVIGVYSEKLVRLLAEVAKKMNKKHVLVVHAEDGLDEISVAAPTKVCELKAGAIEEYTITPEQFGLKRSSLDSLVVANAAQSMRMVEQVFAGEPSAARDIVVLNAGAGIYVAGKSASLAEGVQYAQQAIDSGSAKQIQADYIRATQAAI